MAVCRFNVYISISFETDTDLNYLRYRLPLAFCPLIAAQFAHHVSLSFCIVCRIVFAVILLSI